MVNDGSTDRTVVLAESYKKQSEFPVTVISQENKGVSVARNTGLEAATGEIICFLDADDRYRSLFLMEIVRAFEAYSVDIVLTRYFRSNSDAGEENLPAPMEETIEKDKHLNRYELFNLYAHHKREKVNFWNCGYLKSIIDRYHIHFPVGICYGEDTQFYFQYIFYCERGGVRINKELYEYVANAGSVMRRVSYRAVDNIKACENSARLWKRDSGFPSELGDYIVDRAKWAAAKDLASSEKKDYQRLLKEYPIKPAMKNMMKKGDEMPIRVSSFLFLLNPAVFRVAMRMFMRYSKLLRS